ncbi:MAG: DUF115 domain-containing protein, partial [Spirochaetaceae bacterium]|nr:DUF115 domain-containing protein [Spirochaetaceae bacterium]
MTPPSNISSPTNTTSIHSPPLVTNVAALPARRAFTAVWQGRVLLSRIDPAGQAEKLTESAIVAGIKPQTLYICPRPLFGYGLSAFLQKLPESSRLAAIEIDADLYKWTKANIDKNLFANGNFVLIFAKTEYEAACKLEQLYGTCAFRRIEIFANSAAWQVDAPDISTDGSGKASSVNNGANFYGRLMEILQKELALQWGNAMTLTHLGRLYARNLVRNLPLLAFCPDVAEIDFTGNNVLVCGAGPSLENTAKHLEHNSRQRLRIIAVDTALSALLAHGINPDLVIALESQHWNAGDFTGLSGRVIPLAMDMSALPLTAHIFSCPPYIFWTEWTPLCIFERLKKYDILPLKLPALGSVGLSAYSLARHLNANSIDTAGLDFAYTPDIYHCKGSPSHLRLLRQSNRFRCLYPLASVYREGSYVCDMPDGSKVRKDPALEKYHRLFEVLTAEIRSGGSSAKRQTPLVSKKERLSAFLKDECRFLEELLEMLTGGGSINRLDELLDACDYLWAHFPDCAGRAGRRPPASSVNFLKR